MEYRIFSGAPWEKKVGYCRAVRSGNVIAVSGTTAPGADVYLQTQAIFQIIDKALSELGASKKHIIRTRIFVTDISQWEVIGKAHSQFFGAHVPATSMVQVSSLISPELFVEIEADAVIG